MIILCTYEEASKKAMKDVYKIIVSDAISKTKLKNSVITGEFLPDPRLFASFYDGYIKKKEYRNHYWEMLENEEEIFASVLTIMILYRRGDTVSLVCDESEVQYQYLQFLADYISERYGVKIGTYKDFKKHDGKVKNKMSEKGEKRLKKDIKQNKDMLEDALEASKKKDKKKKNKKKDKKKSKDKKHKNAEYMFTPTVDMTKDSYAKEVFQATTEVVTLKQLFKKSSRYTGKKLF